MTAWLNATHVGDCRDLLGQMATDGVRVQTCVTSPPYFGLRDYGCAGQLGLEQTPEEYVAELVKVLAAVRNLLADDGTLWLNLGDCYVGAGSTEPAGKLKAKDLIGVPWRVAFALQADGWYLRSDIIWHKANAMPESVTDRPTKAHEYLFLLAKSERYYYDAESIKERGTLRASGNGQGKYIEDDPRHRTKAGFLKIRQKVYEHVNRRTVWTLPTEGYHGAHFAVFPRALIAPCIVAGARPGDVVLDPFMGSGTTAQVATDLGRQFIGCEINAQYVDMHDVRRTTLGMPL